MTNKAIFLDRDGTITNSGDHIYKIEDLVFLPRVIEGLKKLQETGYKFIIVTNQAGIAKGLFSENEYFAFRNELYKRLDEQGILIDAEYFCPHHINGVIGKYKFDCNCRKPKTGMLEQAAKDFDLNLAECWMIGDNPSDLLAGKKAGCRTIHVLTGEEKKPVIYADFEAKDLVEAANCILINS
jgi:D-glycero-D-manno-heptose 1,7-bisphosphate phosphatase